MGLLPGLDAQLEFSESEMGYAKVEDKGLGGACIQDTDDGLFGGLVSPWCSAVVRRGHVWGLDWRGNLAALRVSDGGGGRFECFPCVMRKQNTFSEPFSPALPLPSRFGEKREWQDERLLT
jgi:hypothetical protein